MRGHAVPDWEMSPSLLCIWLLRVLVAGRAECPALGRELADSFGQDAAEAVAAAQLLALGVVRGVGRPWETPAGPTAKLAAHERTLCDALEAACGGEHQRAQALCRELSGPYAALLFDAIEDLARLIAAHGLLPRSPAPMAAE